MSLLGSKALEELAPLALLFFLRSRDSSSAPSSPSSPALPPAPAPTTGGEVPRVRTGEDNVIEWRRRRLALAIASLRGMVPDALLDRVALSIVAQWAHETARGRSEFNNNLGGWRARKGEQFFTARDVQSGDEIFRWSSYPDLPTGVQDQIQRLASRFPSAFALLVENPESSAWVEELGRKGYYEADPRIYARVWATHRTELGRMP